jgi:hypothetical protein
MIKTRLVIPCINAQHFGEYSCQADNGCKQIQSTAIISPVAGLNNNNICHPKQRQYFIRYTRFCKQQMRISIESNGTDYCRLDLYSTWACEHTRRVDMSSRRSSATSNHLVSTRWWWTSNATRWRNCKSLYKCINILSYSAIGKRRSDCTGCKECKRWRSTTIRMYCKKHSRYRYENNYVLCGYDNDVVVLTTYYREKY